ncbi:hypothetical protein Tco_0310088 [Tanacetum coccineum]
MTLQELMVFCTTLSKKVESLETDLKQTKQIYGDAYTRLIKKKVESLETDLKQTKQIYGAAYTKLIKKVQKLEKIVKSSQAK